MRHDGDITHGKHHKDGVSTGDRTLRLTVPEAAGVMGISAEAVRQRIKRGTLPTEKDAGGTVFVLLAEDLVRDRSRQVDDSTRKDSDITSDSTHDRTRQDADSTALIESLQEQVEYLKETVAKRDEEIRRRDHLLAAALERIPAIEEAPSETQESPMTASEEPYSTHAPPEPQEPSQRRSWWAFFGLE
jgi:hypothetical protein